MKIQIHTLPIDLAGTRFAPLGQVSYIERQSIESLTEQKQNDMWIIVMNSGAIYGITTEELLKYDLLNTKQQKPPPPVSYDPF